MVPVKIYMTAALNYKNYTAKKCHAMTMFMYRKSCDVYIFNAIRNALSVVNITAPLLSVDNIPGLIIANSCVLVRQSN